MFTLESFNTQLVTIMNAFADAVIEEIKQNTTIYLSRANNEDEGKLDVILRIKCIEASNSIMRLLREMTNTHEDSQHLNQSQPEVINESSSREEIQETLLFEGVTNSGLREEELKEVPSQDESKSFFSPTVDLDHHYIRSSSSPSITAMREKNRTAARHARKKMKGVDADIVIAKSSRVQHVCRHCGTFFSAIIDLRDHERHVHKVVDRPYSCDYCEKTFSHKPHRDRHHRLHRGERMFQCEVCGKAYTTISQLKTHKQTHSEKSFICDVCGNGFYQSGHLTRHKLVHKDVRPFQCDTCGKGFTQAEGLKNHQLTHTDERELCPVCGRGFRNLRHHMINKHSEELPPEEARRRQKTYICQVTGCGKKFLYPSLLNLHNKRTHESKLTNCGSLRKGMKGELGPAGSEDTQTVEKPHVCTFCGSSFSMACNLERHKSIHTGEMPYNCLECGKRFRLLDFLKTHEKVHMKHRMERDQSRSDEGIGSSVS